MKKWEISRSKIALLAASVFLVGFYMGRQTAPDPLIRASIRENSAKYTYINPLIIAPEIGSSDDPPYRSLKDVVAEYIEESIKNKKAESISFYFKDLNTGQWTGLHEEEPFAPSSMLKVVVMLAYLDRAEDDPKILTTELNYVPTDYQEHFVSPSLKAGKHTVSELVDAMIAHSDNAALDSLFAADNGHIAEVNRVLRLPMPATGDATKDFMSARSYSLVFRTLYNATYLSKDVSERALELLTKTTFNDGLVSGVPKGTTVAHKFGERLALNKSPNDNKELHDCGIIYRKSNPYFLCVMTKGGDFSNLSESIKGISEKVYTYLSKN